VPKDCCANASVVTYLLTVTICVFTRRCMQRAMVLEVVSVSAELTQSRVPHFWNPSNTSSSGSSPSIPAANTALLCRPRVRSFLGAKEKTENLDTAIASSYPLSLFEVIIVTPLRIVIVDENLSV